LLHEVCRRAGIAVDRKVLSGLVEERRDHQAQLFRDPDPEVIEMLDRCRAAGLKLAVVSNAAVEDVEAWRGSELESLFDATAFSYEVGAAKPLSEIFEVALARLGREAAEACMVSDAVSDLEGARRVGVSRGIWATWFLDRRSGVAVDADLAGDRLGVDMTRAKTPHAVINLVEDADSAGASKRH